VSQIFIQQYLNHLSDLRRISGANRESIVSEAFKDLLKNCARAHELVFIPQYEVSQPGGERRYVDGALLHALRVPFGYWEAKDEDDDLEREIANKFRRGYPSDNIIFEDSTQAILYQNGREVARCRVDEINQLDSLLTRFFAYQRPEIAEFRRAVSQFKRDLPAVIAALRDMIDAQLAANTKFAETFQKFLKHAQEAINPDLGAPDVREMLIQHILTEEIFSKVFGEDDFHRHNNVARELYVLEESFFVGAVKKKTLKGLETYYAAIRVAAAKISSHHEKQKFLKAIYEDFYRVYNPKAADRLGVVYTPNEVVRFMIESADWLCVRHFGRSLIDRQVQILDPATGTGTFIAELLEHFRGRKDRLRHKYLEELHANEVAILPYYVANLNIEATYAAITGEYLEYPNLCFVDTLDNVGRHTAQRGTNLELFAGMSEENVARIRRQNAREISVVIGNPPYNAQQRNENENNKNRDYRYIDDRIAATYVAKGTAQKTKGYDMYRRFFRWSSDRLGGNGILALITNNNLIEAKEADGFRRVLAEEFNEIWVVDLKGDARSAGERRRREGGNIFDDQIRVGVAVCFCVRKAGARGCKIYYDGVRDYARAEEKLEFLTSKPMAERTFLEVRPDVRHNWINIPENDFETFLPIASKAVKRRKRVGQDVTIFKSYSLGVSTNRDEWVYDMDKERLKAKVKRLIAEYDAHKPATGVYSERIKWSETLKRRADARVREAFDAGRVRRASYRPFVPRYLYLSPLFVDRPGAAERMFPAGGENLSICFSDVGSRTEYAVLAVDGVADLHFGSSTDAYQQVPLRIFDENGAARSNIVDAAYEAFKSTYKGGRRLTRESIFYYVYGVLHDPVYREKYAMNLVRDFPRIPFYADFWRWSEWGKRLVELHVGYENVRPYKLDQADRAAAAGDARPILRGDPTRGVIVIDTSTTLSQVPREAWRYRLGSRSAIEWVLEQHRARKTKNATVPAELQARSLAREKKGLVNLLARVITVSVETVKILEQMAQAKR
jgi:predicted helicase